MIRKRYLALLTAGALAALACGSGGGDDQAAGGGGKADKTAAVATIGKPARDGKFEFTVTKVDCKKTTIGSEPLTQTAQGKFCLVSVTVKNIAKEAQLFDASSQKALDKAGTTYDADSGAAIYVNKQADTFLNNINPGNSVKGVLPFDVPKNVTVTAVELHDSPFSGGVRVNIS